MSRDRKRYRSEPSSPAATSTHPSSPAALFALPPSVMKRSPSHIVLNVGGVPMATERSTLTRLCPESKLATWAENGFAGLPVDSEGRPFIDRDPNVFRSILNFLRGYPLDLSPEQVFLVEEDAKYFDLPLLLETIGGATEVNRPWTFLPGPGVNVQDNSFSTVFMVAHCGSRFFSKGVHTIHLKMEKCEVVGVSVINEQCTTQHATLQSRKGSITYMNTGEITSSIEGEQVAAAVRYRDGDTVSVVLQFIENKARVVFLKGGVEVTTVEVAAQPLKFAVTIGGYSVVQLLDSTSES